MTRREFLKLAAAAVAGIVLPRAEKEDRPAGWAKDVHAALMLDEYEGAGYIVPRELQAPLAGFISEGGVAVGPVIEVPMPVKGKLFIIGDDGKWEQIYPEPDEDWLVPFGKTLPLSYGFKIHFGEGKT